MALLGTIGTGKTLLTKKITGDESLVAKVTACSLTDKLFKRPIVKGTYERDDFYVLDGPGMNASTD